VADFPLPGQQGFTKERIEAEQRVPRSFGICVPEGYRRRPANALGEYGFEADDPTVFSAKDRELAFASARKPRVFVSFGRRFEALMRSPKRAREEAGFEDAYSVVAHPPWGLEVLSGPRERTLLFLSGFVRLSSSPPIGAKCHVGWSAKPPEKADATVETARAICASLRAM
jgi:hypothetical protein